MIIQNHYTFDNDTATGTQIKEMANIPEGFALQRRIRLIRDTLPECWWS